MLILALIILAGVKYAWAVYNYHRSRRRTERECPPPTYPATFPYFGNVLPFVLDTAGFVRRATYV